MPIFGADWPLLDSDAAGEWWKPSVVERGPKKGQPQEPRLLVPRNQVAAFALYTHDHEVLKLSTQLYPLMPDEPRQVTLEFRDNDQWKPAATTDVVYPGWSDHFRIKGWDNTKSVAYRVRLADQSAFEGIIRRDPQEEKAGPGAVPDSPLPWTGEFEDGPGNLITMLAYANPEDPKQESKRADGYAISRFDRTTRNITFECWPRFSDVSDGVQAQFPGWPITIAMADSQNDRVSLALVTNSVQMDFRYERTRGINHLSLAFFS